MHASTSSRSRYGYSRIKSSTLSPAAIGWKLGATPGADVLLARAALLEQPMPDLWQADLQRGSQSQFPVSAADLMPIYHGPALGTRLADLQARWLASDLRLTKEMLLA